MISHRQSPEPAVAVTAPATMAGSTGRLRAAPYDDVTVTAAECVGPVALPSAVTGALRTLTAAIAADDFLALWICAGVLAGRLSRHGGTCRAWVIQGKREALTLADPLDGAISFRTALSPAARSPLTACVDPSRAPAAVIILVSQDGSRLYAESVASADPPVAPWWARSFVHLLSSMVLNPDAPMAGHPLLDKAGRPL